MRAIVPSTWSLVTVHDDRLVAHGDPGETARRHVEHLSFAHSGGRG
jgi:hypothetical protein